MITNKQSHIDADLYQLAEENKNELLEMVQEKQMSYNSMVRAAFSNPNGQKLLEKMKADLAKPTFTPGCTSEEMLLQEGARQYIMSLLKAYEMGGEQNKPKQK